MDPKLDPPKIAPRILETLTREGEQPPTSAELKAFTTPDGKLKIDNQTKKNVAAAVFLLGKPHESDFVKALSPGLDKFLGKLNTRGLQHFDVRQAFHVVAGSVRFEFFERLRRLTKKWFFEHLAEEQFIEYLRSQNPIQLDAWYQKRIEKDVMLYLLAPFAEAIDIESMLDDEVRVSPEAEARHQLLKSFAHQVCVIMATLILVHKVNPLMCGVTHGEEMKEHMERIHGAFDGIRDWNWGVYWEDLPLRLADIVEEEEEEDEDEEESSKDKPREGGLKESGLKEDGSKKVELKKEGLMSVAWRMVKWRRAG